MRIILNITLLVLGLCTFASDVYAKPPAMYHLSMLFPLPESQMDDLPGLELKNCDQEILGFDVYQNIPRLQLTPQTHRDEYESLRLVGLRWDLDENEARLIFQPLRENSDRYINRHIFAEDAALHLFLKAPDTQSIPNELSRLQRRFDNLPQTTLGVHPSFEQAAQVKTKLAGVLCRLAHWPMYKATFMTERRGRVMWHFGGFHIDESSGLRKLGPELELVNTGEKFRDDNNQVSSSNQRIVRGAGRLRANVFPGPIGGDDLGGMFHDGADVFETSKAAATRRIIDRIENPLLNSPKTVDCVSCHAAESARRMSENHYAMGPSEDAFSLPSSYSLDQSVSNLTLENTINFRSFGYYDYDAVISRRVLFESYQFQKNWRF